MNCRTKRFKKGVGKYYSGGLVNSFAPGGDLPKIKEQTFNPIERLTRNHLKNGGVKTISTTGIVWNVDGEKGTPYNPETGDSVGFAEGTNSENMPDYSKVVNVNDPNKIDQNMQNKLNTIRAKMNQMIQSGSLPTDLYNTFKSQGVKYTKGPNGEFKFTLDYKGMPYALYTATFDTSSNNKSVPPNAKTLEKPIEPYTFTPRPNMSSTMIQNKMERIPPDKNNPPSKVIPPTQEKPNTLQGNANFGYRLNTDKGYLHPTVNDVPNENQGIKLSKSQIDYLSKQQGRQPSKTTKYFSPGTINIKELQSIKD